MQSSPVKVTLTDHQLAEIVRKNQLKLNNSHGSNYYHNDNFSIELLIIFDNAKPARNVFATFDTIKTLDLKTAHILFKQLKNGDKFKTNCYEETVLRKASERSATDENLNIVHVMPLAEIIKISSL